MEKPYDCERCGIKLSHRGRCLPCNYFYKHNRYIFALKENPEYDKQHGMHPLLAKLLIENYQLKQKLKKFFKE